MLEQYDLLNRLEQVIDNTEINGKVDATFLFDFLRLERNRLDQELPCPEDYEMICGGGYESQKEEK